MKLHELSPDQILAELEARSDLYVAAAEQEARAEAAHKAMEATIYKINRADKQSIEDAKASVRESTMYLDSLSDLITKQTTALRCRAALDRAKIAVELYRTIRADQRRI
jgi:hypothetical protein